MISLKLTGGRGVDIAFEAAGADETPEQAAEVVRPGGKVIITGIPKDDSLSFNASVVTAKRSDHQAGAAHGSYLPDCHPVGGKTYG